MTVVLSSLSHSLPNATALVAQIMSLTWPWQGELVQVLTDYKIYLQYMAGCRPLPHQAALLAELERQLEQLNRRRSKQLIVRP